MTSALTGWAFAPVSTEPYDPRWRPASWLDADWASGDVQIAPTRGAVLAWNAVTPPGAAILFEIAARIEGAWSPWTPMGEWGEAPPVAQPDGPVRRNLDVATWEKPADAIRVRGRRLPARNGALADVRRVIIACDAPAAQEPCPGPPAPGPTVFPIPFRSQMDEPPELAPRVCGPTSLAMHLAPALPGLRTADVAAAAFDARHDIYGNWAHLAAVASEHGFAAWIERHACLAEVEARLLAGYGAILSIAYEEGELAGSPIPRTDGHLLVLRGWDDRGDPVLNDPAFPDRRGDGVVYRRSEFERVWGGHGGATILLRPER